MPRRLTAIAFLFFALCAACSRSGSTASTCKVIRVADGDTITVVDSNSRRFPVRLQGIDAPENRQAFGNTSRQHLDNLVFGKEVILQGDKFDKYGRMVCKVTVDGRDVNLDQIESGCAWVYRQYEDELSGYDRERYEAAESNARNAGRGLWKDPSPIPPWQYRHPEGVPASEQPDMQSNGQSNGKGNIIGNRRNRVYHWPGCPDYDKIAPHNREFFNSRDEAERAGYRPARNCDH
jgi:endonuclease YncB( thermonuclease family)